MLEQKIAHPKRCQHRLGAQPTGATLHALHYHQCWSAMCRRSWKNQLHKERDNLLNGLLTIPVAVNPNWTRLKTAGARQQRAGILGYVVRWIDQGVVAPRCLTSTTSA